MEGSETLQYDDLWSILVDLRENSTLQHSSRLAELVLEGLHRDGAVAGRAVKQANFVVLRTLSMPAILVEAGFLSHPQEARELAASQRQAQLGLALASSVIAWVVSPAFAASDARRKWSAASASFGARFEAATRSATIPIWSRIATRRRPTPGT